MEPNIDFFISDQIQTPQYLDVHPPSQETSEEVSQAIEDLIKSIQTFLEEFHCIPLKEKPTILLQAWFKFFATKHDQLENSNKLIQELLEDLKELAEYKESLENSSKEIVVSNSNEEKEEPPQDSDIHQLIEECSVEVSEEQKQKMENTILELVEICREKELLCIHDNVDDLIESTLNTKLLSINSNSQRLDNKEEEVKNVIEQPTDRRNLAPVLPTKEPEHSLSMGYEHLSITPKMESNEVTESNAENLLPIPSECEVTSDDEIYDDESLPEEDVRAEEFKVYSNPLLDENEINSDKLDPHCFNVKSDFVESLLNRDTFIDSSSKFDFSSELAHVNPEFTEFDVDFEEEIHLIENLLNDNSSPRPPEELNAEIADTIVESMPSLPILVQDGDIRFPEELLIDDSILSHESSYSNFEDNPSFQRPPTELPDVEFDFKPDAEEEIPVVMNEKHDFDVSNDENDDYFTFIALGYMVQIRLVHFCLKEPKGIKEVNFDLEEEIRLVENLLYDNSSPRPPEELNAEIADTIVESLSSSPIPVEDKLLVKDSLPLPENESSNFDHQNDPSFPRRPPEPPNVEFFFDFELNSREVISAVMNNIDELNEDECFDPGREINVFATIEDDDYFPLIFVIQNFLPYLIYPEVSSLLLSAGSEDTIFDPGISV
nr:hypothetical protein [Tanacetum cinerariifolium]